VGDLEPGCFGWLLIDLGQPQMRPVSSEIKKIGALLKKEFVKS
jgi:hypothetical protein